MAPQIPVGEPTTIVAGDTVQFTKGLGDFSALDGWVLKYRLFGPVGTAATPLVDKTVTGAVQGGGWLVAFAPADTAAINADGTFRLVGQVSLSGETHTIYDAVVVIDANPLTTTPVASQTHADRALALIEAAIEKRLPADMEHYQIDGKSVGKIETRQLMRLRARYRHEVWRQRHPTLAAPQRTVVFSATR